MLLSKCAVCRSKKSRLIKEQEASGLLSSLGLKTPLSQISLVGSLLFYRYQMNTIINKFLLAGDKFMSEINLRKPRFTYNACGPFTRNKEKIQKIKETGDSKYIYQNELGKAYFQHVMAYGDFKDLTRRTVTSKALRDKAFNVAKNSR